MSIRVKVILTAEVGEGALLAKLYGFAIDGDGEKCGGGLFGVGAVVWEFICAEFSGRQVQFKYLGKCCN